jgi:cytochrome P450
MKVYSLLVHVLNSPAEVKSMCLTMVSAGLDTVPANLIQGIAYLATPHGQRLQGMAYAALLDAYGRPEDAWHAVLKEEKVPFVTALVKETLRYYTVIAMCLPRESIKPIQYKGATIPAGTLFYMNAHAADFDPSRFTDPYDFNPERYIQDTSVRLHPLMWLMVRLEKITARLSRTTRTAQDLGCVPDLTWRIGSCSWLLRA